MGSIYRRLCRAIARFFPNRDADYDDSDAEPQDPAVLSLTLSDALKTARGPCRQRGASAAVGKNGCDRRGIDPFIDVLENIATTENPIRAKTHTFLRCVNRLNRNNQLEYKRARLDHSFAEFALNRSQQLKFYIERQDDDWLLFDPYDIKQDTPRTDSSRSGSGRLSLPFASLYARPSDSSLSATRMGGANNPKEDDGTPSPVLPPYPIAHDTVVWAWRRDSDDSIDEVDALQRASSDGRQVRRDNVQGPKLRPLNSRKRDGPIIRWNAPGASCVEVMGNFTNPPWTVALELFKCSRTGVFWLSLREVVDHIQPGLYLYKYRVDGVVTVDRKLPIQQSHNGQLFNILVVHQIALKHAKSFEDLQKRRRSSSAGMRVYRPTTRIGLPSPPTRTRSVPISPDKYDAARHDSDDSTKESTGDPSSPRSPGTHAHDDAEPESPRQSLLAGLPRTLSTPALGTTVSVKRHHRKRSIQCGEGGESGDLSPSSVSSSGSGSGDEGGGYGRMVVCPTGAVGWTPEVLNCLHAMHTHADVMLEMNLPDLRHAKALRLTAGACSIPHPDKRSRGGEDAFFIWETTSTDLAWSGIGVADGVGEWTNLGLNARQFADELMDGCKREVVRINERLERRRTRHIARQQLLLQRQQAAMARKASAPSPLPIMSRNLSCDSDDNDTGASGLSLEAARRLASPGLPVGQGGLEGESLMADEPLEPPSSPLMQALERDEREKNFSYYSNSLATLSTRDLSAPLPDPTPAPKPLAHSAKRPRITASVIADNAELSSSPSETPDGSPRGSPTPAGDCDGEASPSASVRDEARAARLQRRMLQVLKAGYANTRAWGSSTACVACLDEEGGRLGVANLGDSGLIVLRRQTAYELEVVKKTVEQQHGFNCPYQLMRVPKKSDLPYLEQNGLQRLASWVRGIPEPANHDLPECADISTVDLMEGDLVILGTDGVFDNLFEHEIAALANLAMSPYEALLLHDQSLTTSPKNIATAIAEAAFNRSQDLTARTPFASNAAASRKLIHKGGKADDITVVAAWCVREPPVSPQPPAIAPSAPPVPLPPTSSSETPPPLSPRIAPKSPPPTGRWRRTQQKNPAAGGEKVVGAAAAEGASATALQQRGRSYSGPIGAARGQEQQRPGMRRRVSSDNVGGGGVLSSLLHGE
ncbi:unnamed protein product [Vitrella brassicaformis CCMP3155]|uniref:PPM-type phosphatase domain-containing protein n=3 Tax=Vitrella brassicaformis TaxID=1169539 RepID=A0A0G4FE54_VITBC|nr:unnamed protein product [Vitrella brassicaformis CCMP3155]|eukprot:CEM11485.1 unnamed protein product [Vitrella brassicaformis CCMP3155]